MCMCSKSSKRGWRFSLVVEHLSCKQKVMGSIPIVASHIFAKHFRGRKKGKTGRSWGRESREVVLSYLKSSYLILSHLISSQVKYLKVSCRVVS